MTEVIKLRLAGIASKVMELAGESRGEMALEWLENLKYCMEHMDEQKFATDFICYLEWLLGYGKEPVARIQDKIVMNTLQQLANDLAMVQGRKRSKLLTLSQLNRKETLLPCGIWVWRGHHSRIYKTSDGYRVEASIEKYNYAQQMEGFISKLNELM